MKNIAIRNWHWLGLESETGYHSEAAFGTENNYVLKGQIVRFRKS